MPRKIFMTLIGLGLLLGPGWGSGLLKTGGAALLSGTVIDEQGLPLPGVPVAVIDLTGKRFGVRTDGRGRFAFPELPEGEYRLLAGMAGFKTVEVTGIRIAPGLEPVELELKLEMLGPLDPPEDEILLEEESAEKAHVRAGATGGVRKTQPAGLLAAAPMGRPEAAARGGLPPGFDTEEYALISENRYLPVLSHPLSTFSIDVDTASYANVRRFIRDSRFPLKDAVRIEEMINYFTYDYPLPEGDQPFSVFAEISDCPWNRGHRLVHIGLQGRKPPDDRLPPGNLVFLLDVSGSMGSPDKLPLLRTAFKLLVRELRPVDRVAIVVYAGAAGLILPSTPASKKDPIFEAVDRLQAGGSTAGGAGIRLAYQVAEENFIRGGNNRVILATDGDFNVGVSSTSELVRMVEERRDQGIFLTVLGFGTGNVKDGRMEQLADRGNGNYFYLDGLLEAKKVFIDELRGTLFTIAKDVKIQVEFNPARVKAYRLVGYENRLLDREDFADDTRDAGELGAGHTVTALYEIIPYGSEEEIPGVDRLKYQDVRIDPKAFESRELLTARLRFKAPDGEESRLIEFPLTDEAVPLDKSSNDFRFSAAVAEFGMLLRDSEFKGDSTWGSVLELAEGARGADRHGYRGEFIRLVETCRLLEKTGER